MSENEEEEAETNSEDADAFDPLDPTKVDPQRAFEMGAETPYANAVPADWSPPEPEVIDPLFPDYDLIELIGRGGMGAVYRGTQKSLDRPVAIKVLPPEMAEADPSFAARFEREAKSMARLDHPNIVHVYDFGRTEAGHWFIVMEFVDGMDFHQLIRSGTLDQTGALNSVSQICDALQYAHEQGYVHRDIKPANIFINQKGILKVGDFGLAKMIEGDAEEPGTQDQPMLTQTGISMGTPDYCAPEQIEGGHIDHRADIYSLGVMLYEMLTRELPRGNFPPPSKKVEIDVRIDDVVLRAMESEPEMRYSTAGEMRTEVDEVRTGVAAEPSRIAGESRSQPTASKSKGDRTVAKILIVLAGIAGIFAFFGVVIALGFLILKPKGAAIKLGKSSPELQVTGDSEPLREGTVNRYGLPAFHGELRPIPGTAGWRTEEPGELAAVAVVPNPKPASQLCITKMPEALTDVISVNFWSLQLGLAVLKDGSARVWGDEDKAVIQDFPSDLKDVIALETEATGTLGIALHKDGTVTPWGRGQAVDRLRAADPQRIVSISAIESRGFLLANADGDLLEFFSNEHSYETPRLKNVRAILGDSGRAIVIHRDGSLSPIHYPPEKKGKKASLISIPSDLPPVRAMTSSFVTALLEDGRVISWADGESKILGVNADKMGLGGRSPNWIHVKGVGWKLPGLAGDQSFAQNAIKDLSMVVNQQDRAGIGDWAVGIKHHPQLSAPTATKDPHFTNSLGMEFVPVAVPNGPTGGKRVLFSQWETRVADYRAFAESTKREWPAPEFEQGDDHPAVNVSWEDAGAFCEWLTKREREAGTIGPTERYRLPSDHEWSCAVEIGHLEDQNDSPISKSPPHQDRPPPGTDTAVKGYPMGDRVYGGFANSAGEETKAAGLSNNIVHGMKDGYAATAPVGNYKPNRFGLFDISGNVWEWCENTIDPDSKYTRVRRGACWKTVFIPAMRSARREGATQDSRLATTGFRCVLSED